jgi:aryl-alcohol dehydrogenase-like predicted oxidoreductase
MQHKLFGKTGEKIFALGIGTFGHGEAYGGITKNESFDVFQQSLSFFGRNAKILIDTAPKYGNGRVEEWIGEFKQQMGRDRFLIATKGGRHIDAGRINEKDFSPSFLKTDLDNSLKRMGTESVFLYQLHNPTLQQIKEGSIFDTLEKFRDEGKIAHYGVSIDDPDEGIAAITVCRERGFHGFASIQVIYNILNKEKRTKLFEVAHRNAIAIIAREPLLRGFLTGKYSRNHDFSNAPEAVAKMIKRYGKEKLFLKVAEIEKIAHECHVKESLTQISIAFAQSNPHVTTVIPGINRSEYVKTDLTSAEIKLDENVLKRLQEMEDVYRIEQ